MLDFCPRLVKTRVVEGVGDVGVDGCDGVVDGVGSAAVHVLCNLCKC